MMTNKEILRIAIEQSAVDANCQPEDFMKTEPVIVTSRKNPDARRYLNLPLACNLISYGNNIVASIDRRYEEIVRNYIQKYPVEHCFETPNLHVLNEAFAKHDLMVCFMAEYFLPDVNALTRGDCRYEMRLLENSDFHELYRPEWQNEMCIRDRANALFGTSLHTNYLLWAAAGLLVTAAFTGSLAYRDRRRRR